MDKHTCGNCNFRAKFDNNPRSWLGRIWKWHAGWCPGWRKYITSLPDPDRIQLAKKYDMKKFQ